MRIANMLVQKRQLIIYQIALFLLSLPAVLFASPTEISIYTYHTHAPFIVDPQQGLSYDLAEYLSTKSLGRYQFIVKSMSRPRVNKMLEQGEVGIVPWVNPAWFKDGEETKYLWSQGVLMQDSNAVLSQVDKKIVFRGIDSVRGVAFGGVRGHHYQGLDDWVSQKVLSRIDAENHIDNFRKLMRKRIDFTITPMTGAIYLLKQHNMQEHIFISPTPHSSYDRRLIIADKNLEMKTFVEKTLEQMQGDPLWLELINRYK